ncbi:Mercuric transport protein periplasmic component [Polaribacter huanghezhanensis]|uniref:cation transporter n=1 Tax=Polaribacter huanghezhanensis TaxID=1354726 RepID=UPI00264743C1|nr:cation transporter [Polaribacter huanghezhanensis]WKD86907.1 Mercuric transport protein periplasmic component [Polaribacter huanghezhanensis]
MKIKNILIVLVTIINVSIITSCSSSDKKTEKTIIVKESDIVRESIGVNGMTCVGCEVTLEDNISKIEGVVSVKASHTEKKATIEFDSTKTDIKTITKTIKKSGYKPFKN